MILVYVAGKYRGPNAWAVEQNIRRAEEVAARVWALGHAAICPHANIRHMDGVATDDVFLAGTLEMLRRCDAVLLVPGWQESVGARAEVEEAKRRGIPVFGKATIGVSQDHAAALEEALVALDEWAGDHEAFNGHIQALADALAPFVGKPFNDDTVREVKQRIDAVLEQRLGERAGRAGRPE